MARKISRLLFSSFGDNQKITHLKILYFVKKINKNMNKNKNKNNNKCGNK